MKVLLTHGYFISEDNREIKIVKPYAPLGILYLCAWLEKNGYPNEVFDSTFSQRKDLELALLESCPDVLGIYTNLITKLNVLRIIHFVKSREELKNTTVVIGGPDTTFNVENYLDAGADILVIGEGEESMLEIVEHRQGSQTDWSEIRGIAFRDQQGKTQINPPRSRMKDLDILPMPAREKINVQQYLDIWTAYHGRSALSISTQRGCPYTCRWCSTAVFGQSYRRRSPRSVVREMKYLKKVYNPDLIWFVDDVFTVSHRWIKEFYQEVLDQEAVIPFECITRAERLNEEILSLLLSCGCRQIWIGAESGSQRILDAMDRKVEIQVVTDTIRAARNLGIETGTFIMLGYPGETEQDIKATLQYLRQARPDQVTFTIAYPIKGTSLYEEQKVHFSSMDWNNQTDRDLDFPRSYPRKYYFFALRWLHYSYLLFKQKSAPLSSSLVFGGIRTAFIISICKLGMWWYRNRSEWT